MTFTSYKTAARWEVLVDTKLTHLFCAAQIDSKVKEGEETFVMLIAEHNLSYSCGDVIMKFIKGTFHWPKSCQEHKKISKKIYWPKQRNICSSVPVCYWFVFVMPITFFHSFHATAVPSSSSSPWAFPAEQDATWYRISLWSVRVCCPGSVSCQPLDHQQPTGLLGRREETELGPLVGGNTY